MKILIDIGHPAHVHYFKNFIWIMQEKGHELCIVAREKDVSFRLLDKYGFKYISRGKGAKKLIGKFFYLPKADFIIYRNARKFKPDIFISFSSPYLAHVSVLMNKPHIAFDDTEHARLEQKLFLPFTKIVCTPNCFNRNIGSKQIRFNGYMELCSLHPEYFKPNIEVLNEIGVKENENYIILRFISWNASHDIGQTGIDILTKKNLIFELSKHTKIFISSEAELPEEFKCYQLKVTPEKMHDLLAFASLYIGEGATMASECAMLGTPAIYINTLTAGTLEEQEKYGLITAYRTTAGVLEKVLELLETPDLKEIYQERRNKMLADMIDVTAFMVWFIESYPESAKIMKENPDYQLRFK